MPIAWVSVYFTNPVLVQLDSLSNFNIITLDRLKKMNNAIVRNIGHFDNAVELAGLEGSKDMEIDASILRKSFRLPRGSHGDSPGELDVKVACCTFQHPARSSMPVQDGLNVFSPSWTKRL